MNPTLEKLAVALESGEYKQATKRLRTGDGYCCLGVLCDLHSKEHNEAWVYAMPFGSTCKIYTYGGKCANLPKNVIEWSGVGRWGGFVDTQTLDPDIKAKLLGNPHVDLVYRYRSLADLNDSGTPFAVIAEVIRSPAYLERSGQYNYSATVLKDDGDE